MALQLSTGYGRVVYGPLRKDDGKVKRSRWNPHAGSERTIPELSTPDLLKWCCSRARVPASSLCSCEPSSAVLHAAARDMCGATCACAVAGRKDQRPRHRAQAVVLRADRTGAQQPAPSLQVHCSIDHRRQHGTPLAIASTVSSVMGQQRRCGTRRRWDRGEHLAPLRRALGARTQGPPAPAIVLAGACPAGARP